MNSPSKLRRIILIGLLSAACYAVIWVSGQLSVGNLAWLFPVEDRPIPAANEPVMTPGMKISVSAPFGQISIIAGQGRKRTFCWDADCRSLEMIPRESRYGGSMGLYFPGEGHHWFPHKGISRCVADEGQLNFSSQDKAIAWLSETPGFVPWIYRNDGLAVNVSKNADTLGVSLFQVYVNGQKPSRLQGTQDNKISVVASRPVPSTTHAPEDATGFDAQ